MTFMIKNVTCFVIKKEKLVQISYNYGKSLKLYDNQNKIKPLFFHNVI